MISSLPLSVRTNDRRARGHAGWWAFVIHRVSGIALSVFLPLHFWVLAQAIAGPSQLSNVLRWTEQPLVKASEVGLVFLLAVHMAGGVRLLLVELAGWRAAWQSRLIAIAVGVALLVALVFALNLV